MKIMSVLYELIISSTSKMAEGAKKMCIFGKKLFILSDYNFTRRELISIWFIQ